METTTRASRALTLLVTSLGSFMVLLDGSIIFVALPEIQRSLGTEVSSLQWTVDAYTLPFAALMLTAGTLGDRFGRKKVFLTGLVLFLVGSAFCGFATALTPLIVGRVVQGLGAAAISTGSLSLLVSTFTDPPGRAKAIGIWTAVSGVSLALGPLVGGVLINAFSWNAIFLVNLPIGVLALALGIPRLLESRNPQARHIDVRGQVLIAGGMVCLVMGLIRAQADGWTSAPILTLLAGAIVLLGAFVVAELRSSEPMIPLDLFRNRTFTAVCVIASILGFVIVGSMFFTTQYFQAVQGATPLGTGLRLLPLTLGIFFLSPPASKIAGKKGPRVPVIVGSLLTTVGFLLLATIETSSGYSSVWWKLALVGAGIGMMFAPLTVAVMASVPPQRAGLGSSMINTTRITGFTAGAAVLGTVVLQQFTDKIAAALVRLGVPAVASQAVASDMGGSGALAGRRGAGSGLEVSPAALQSTIQDSFVDAVHVAFFVCAGLTVLASVLAAAFIARGRLAGPVPAQQQAPAGATPVSGERQLSGVVQRTSSALVDTAWLLPRLRSKGVVVVDCTAVHQPQPTGGVTLTSGRAGFDEGHIPGAVFADLLTEFSDPDRKRPFALPVFDKLVAAVEGLGISSDDTVVLYDRAHAIFATRMWWVLRSIGVDNVVVLDGGWRKWTAERLPVSTETALLGRGRLTPVARPELFSGAEEVLDATGDASVSLVNALSPDQHAGRVPVAHGRSGHIPSSVNLPAVSLVDPTSGAFLPLKTLARRVNEVGLSQSDKVIAYCAAGPNATSVAFVLKLLGLRDVSVYDGGLAEWSSDPARPLTATA